MIIISCKHTQQHHIPQSQGRKPRSELRWPALEMLEQTPEESADPKASVNEQPKVKHPAVIYPKPEFWKEFTQ